MTLGDQIKTAREAAGLSQYKLGAKLDLTGQTVYNWEKGNNPPDAAQLARLAEILGVRFTIGD